MDKFREMIHGWLGKLILLLLIVPFAFMGIESYMSSGSDPDEAAQVGDQKITFSQADNAVKAEKDQLLKSLNGDSSRINDENLYQKVLQALIGQTSLIDLSRKLGLRPPLDTAETMLQKEPAFQENGKFSPALLRQYLASTRIPQGELLKQYANESGAQQLGQGLMNSAFASPAEAKKINELADQKRQVSMVLVPIDAYLSQVKVTDQQAQEYYKKHQQEFVQPETADVAYYVLDKNAFASQVSVPESAVEKKYQDYVQSMQQKHARHILVPVDAKTSDSQAKALATQLQGRIAKGEDFATLAKQYSKDPGSASNGGDLGYVGQGSFVPEFEKALNQLKPGQVSAPVKTEYGYHVINLLDSKPAEGVESFSQRRSAIESELKNELVQGKYNEAISKLNQIAVSDGDIKQLAAAMGGQVQQKTGITPSINRASLPQELAQINLKDVIFTDAATQDQEISPGVTVDPDHTVWVQVQKYLPERFLPYAEATSQVKARVQQEGARKLAQSTAEEIARQINAGASPATIAEKYRQPLGALGEIQRGQPGVPPAVTAAAFGLPVPAKGSARAGVANAGKGSGVVVVTGATTPVIQDSKQYQQLLASANAQSELSDLMSYARNREKVKVFKKPVSE